MRISVAPLTLLVCASLASPALALMIDSFEVGNFNVVDVAPGPTNSQQAGLATSEVIGGVRLVRSNATNGGTTTNTLVTTAGLDSATVTFTDAVVPFGEGDAAYTYDGDPDGVNNGFAGLLNVDLSSFLTIDVESTGPAGTVLFQLTFWDSFASQISTPLPNVNGITSFLLSEFNLIDLTDISTIRLAVNSLDPLESVSIGNIYAIPEPTTGLLLTLGLAGLALRKTRGR